jgi:hypothetical protein
MEKLQNVLDEGKLARRQSRDRTSPWPAEETVAIYRLDSCKAYLAMAGPLKLPEWWWTPRYDDC